MAGIPAHLAAGTNKVVNGCGTLTATTKYFRSGKILLRPAIAAAVGALIGSALGTELAAVISEKTLETLMLIALPCVAVFLTVKKDFGKDIPAEERPVYSVRREVVTAALIGLVFGCYDGLLGPGTGTFMILRVMFIGTQVDTVSCKGADSVCCPLLAFFLCFFIMREAGIPHSRAAQCAAAPRPAPSRCPPCRCRGTRCGCSGGSCGSISPSARLPRSAG